MSDDKTPFTIAYSYRKNKQELDPNGVTVRVEYHTRPFLRDYCWVGNSKQYIEKSKLDDDAIDAYVVQDPPDMKQKGYIKL
jgi:hypothetical protein